MHVELDELINSSTKSLSMPFIYAIIVAASGFSYDSAKSIIFMDTTTFKNFASNVCRSFTFILLSAVTIGGAYFLLNRPEAVSHFIGLLAYLFGIFIVWCGVEGASKAIKLATD